jgi:hypothetical protein
MSQAMEFFADGRSDVPDDVVIQGDEVLGRAIVDQLGFMP